jgi:hypothetical protein
MPNDRAIEILDLWRQPHWHRSVLYALSVHDASEDLRLLVGAVVKGMASELKSCLEDMKTGVPRSPIKQLPALLEKWTDPDSIRLAAGEISVPDMRVVLSATQALTEDLQEILPTNDLEAPVCVPQP